MPKVTTQVDVKVVMEMTVEEAKDLLADLGQLNRGSKTDGIFDALDIALENLPKITTKGVE